MLNNTWFYNSSIKKTLEVFGVLFSNIIIRRYDNDNIVRQEFKLPLVYSPRDRLIARTMQVPDLEDNQLVGFTYPCAGFEMTNIQYDASRKLNNNQKIKNCSADGTLSSYLPVPYNITIELSIIATNTTDILQVIEQIVPYFTPSLTVSANISEFGNPASPTNIPFTLDNINFVDNYADNFQDSTREITYTLKFTAQTYIYGAISDDSGKIIKSVNININSGISKYFNDVDLSNNINTGTWTP